MQVVLTGYHIFRSYCADHLSVEKNERERGSKALGRERIEGEWTARPFENVFFRPERKPERKFKFPVKTERKRKSCFPNMNGRKNRKNPCMN